MGAKQTARGSIIHIKKETFDYVTKRYINDCIDGYIIKQTDGLRSGLSIITNGYKVALVDNKNIIGYVYSEISDIET